MHPLLPLSLFILSTTAAVLKRQAGAIPSSGGYNTSTPTASSTSNPSNQGGCPAGLKAVTFNGGYDVNQFDKIGAADHWITFDLSISGTPTTKAAQAHIPMMAFASHVPEAVDMVNGDNPPEWMLTFNEPDYAYPGDPASPAMSAQEAANAIQPLLQRPGKGTKFVAPVTADPNSSWLSDFHAACGCQSFFSVYNIHIYKPTVGEVIDSLNTFHSKWSDKPIWLTEVAPGNANPTCSISMDTAGDFMNKLYSWSASASFVDRMFWNTGNQIGGGDTNVCDSYLLDGGNNASPLLEAFQGVTCS